jgi:hypothetical protein
MTWRLSSSESFSRRRPPVSDRPVQSQGTFRRYGPGFIRIGIKHLLKRQTSGGKRRGGTGAAAAR